MKNAHLAHVLEGGALTQIEMAECITGALSGAMTTAQIAALLGALRVRGETVEELTGAALAVRAMATPVEVDAPVFVDTCGTGGDARGTFNISTGAAIVASACGVVVAKHGNRSVSSRCGSADVLEALGVDLTLSPETLREVLGLTGLAFFYAPAHHPAFRHVAPIRRELGVRTLFNLLGPLANPASARHQVLGVFSDALVPVMAQVLNKLGSTRALVVHGEGLDELSVCGPTHVASLADGRVTEDVVEPEALGLSRHHLATLSGGDAQTNARILRDVLGGQRGGPRDAVLANAAAALLVGGVATTLREGVTLCARAIDSGAAEAHFERFLRVQRGEISVLERIVAAKNERLHTSAPAAREATQPSARSAVAEPRADRALTAPTPSPSPRARALSSALHAAGGARTRVIAELKRRSPSSGDIAPIADPVALAKKYVVHGAVALSVLTDRAHFGGSLDDLTRVAAAVSVPVLRKDFITDPRELDEARAAGASAVLLVTSLLGSGLRRMREACEALGLEALVEVHDEHELRCALDAGAHLIGINNRDLRTFTVDLATTERLAPLVPPHVTLVAESGVRAQADVERLRACGVTNLLVGEFLVRGGRLT